MYSARIFCHFFLKNLHRCNENSKPLNIQGVPRQSVRLYTVFSVGYEDIFGILCYIVSSNHHKLLFGKSFDFYLGTIHKLRRQARGRGLAKCLWYDISLCSKLAYGRGRRVKNWQNLAYVVYGCPHT